MVYYELNSPYSIADWNGLVRAVNEILQNPPEETDCEPIDPIPEVTDPHLWSVGDVTEMRDKLIETCPDISFSEELVIWRPEIIDEIETQMASAWCDCEAACREDCTNALGTVIDYCGAFPTSECLDCTGGCITECTDEERQLATDQGHLAASYMSQWATAWVEYCDLKDEVDDLQNEVDTLEEQLTVLEQARDEACEHGSPEDCANAQAAVDQKQAELDQKQAELDQKQDEMDQKQAEADGYETEAETAAGNSIGYANVVGTAIIANLYTSFIQPGGTWANTACNQLGPKCLVRDPSRCRVSWIIQMRETTVFSWGGSHVGQWINRMLGGFTKDGNPYVTYIRDCGGTPRYACISSGPHACETPCPVTYIHEVRCITRYPKPSGEECCD
jgi:hypothetical protein